MASNNIFSGHSKFDVKCGSDVCDTRFQYCDKSFSCVSCHSYELLAIRNEQLRPIFNLNCRDYIVETYKSIQLSPVPGSRGVVSHPQAATDWLESEKDLIFFLTKLHLCITGLLLAMVVFLVGSKMKRLRRSRQSCRVKLGDPLLWDTKVVPHSGTDLHGLTPGERRAAKKLVERSPSPPPLPHPGKDLDKPSNTGSLFLSHRYQPPPPTSALPPPPVAASSSSSTSHRQRTADQHDFQPPPPLPTLMSRPPVTVGGPLQRLHSHLSSSISLSRVTQSISGGPLLPRQPSAGDTSTGGDTSDFFTSRSDLVQLRMTTTPLHPNSPNFSLAPPNSSGGSSSQFRFDEVPVNYSQLVAQEDSDARTGSLRHS